MIIKKYLQFVNENKLEDFNSIGEWVESLIDDQYIRNIVARYTNDSDPTVDLSNAINILDKKIQLEIKSQIDHYLQVGIEEKEPIIGASTDLEPLTESEVSVAGKGIFTSFLKVITALGQREIQPCYDKCPEHFLLYYLVPNQLTETVKSLFGRFKSLGRYIDIMDYQKNELGLYFGIKCDGQIEYGFQYDTPYAIGQFKLSQSVLKWICQLDLKSAFSLKKELVNLTYSDITTLGKIKTDMLTFQPGYNEKKLAPMIKDRVISFGYYGVGRWDNGKLDEGEFQNIKNNFSSWVLSKKWGSKVLINVKPNSFWVYLNIKLK